MSKHNETKMTGAQCLIRALEDAGVETVFGYPGGHALDIYDALYDSAQLNHVLVRHEQGAVHAADGYARATGRVGTVIVTSGPGATNTVTGIATAYMDSIPLVVITGQVPTDALGSDAFQESDMTGITLPIVKHSYLVKNAADIPATIAQAYHIASTGRPGPVVIDIPSNLARELDVAYSYPAEVKLQSYKPTYKGNSKQVKQAARAIEKAKRPVIYAGGGVIASGPRLLPIRSAWLIMVVAAIIIAYSAFTMLSKALRMGSRRGPSASGSAQTAASAASPDVDSCTFDFTCRNVVLAVVIGLIAGFASGYVGVGGGFIMVPLMTAWLGIPMKRTSGTSLIAIIILAIPGVIQQAFLGHIDYLAGIMLCVGAIPGAVLGAWLMPRVPERTLRFIFAGLLAIAAVMLVVNEFALL